MQSLKGLRALIPFILAGCMILTGCSQEEALEGVTDVTSALFLTEDETTEAAASQESAAAAAGERGATMTVSEISPAAEESSMPPKARNLSENEYQGLQKYINEPGNCGFLLSVYETAQELDAEKVFYAGAGIDFEEPSEEEIEAYLEETGEEEAQDLVRMGAQQVSDYLQFKAGVSLDELRHQPDWVYLEDYDAYYLCRDDEETVIREVEVLDAAEQGDFYRLHYRARRNGQDPDGWHIPTYEVILKKNGDSYRFCANRLWMEKGLLLRPYCEVETEDLGKVKLCAYKPDQTAAQNADVTFCFVKDWDILCRFPGMDSRNIRKDMAFRDVKAVDLGDYDRDGWSEVVTICEYEILQEGAGRPDGLEARIYRFDEDGMPELDSELSAEINRNVSNLSLSGIAHYVTYGADRKRFDDRISAYAAEVEEADPDSYDRFALVYVNDDRFPELLEWGTSTDKGAKIVFYQDGELLETKVSAAFSFLKKENLLFSRSGTGNLFTESIYVFAGDSFEVYQSGTYGTMDAAITSYTKAGKPQYTYKWEGSIVSEAGYRDALLFLYDENRALDPNKITMLGTEEMLAELKK